MQLERWTQSEGVNMGSLWGRSMSVSEAEWLLRPFQVRLRSNLIFNSFRGEEECKLVLMKGKALG